eukprot:1026800-Rhodomonas_salina.1
MREAEEKGKRLEEERRRAKQDEMYRQVMHVHQVSLDPRSQILDLPTHAPDSGTSTTQEVLELVRGVDVRVGGRARSRAIWRAS